MRPRLGVWRPHHSAQIRARHPPHPRAAAGAHSIRRRLLEDASLVRLYRPHRPAGAWKRAPCLKSVHAGPQYLRQRRAHASIQGRLRFPTKARASNRGRHRFPTKAGASNRDRLRPEAANQAHSLLEVDASLLTAPLPQGAMPWSAARRVDATEHRLAAGASPHPCWRAACCSSQLPSHGLTQTCRRRPSVHLSALARGQHHLSEAVDRCVLGKKSRQHRGQGEYAVARERLLLAL